MEKQNKKLDDAGGVRPGKGASQKQSNESRSKTKKEIASRPQREAPDSHIVHGTGRQGPTSALNQPKRSKTRQDQQDLSERSREAAEDGDDFVDDESLLSPRAEAAWVDPTLANRSVHADNPRELPDDDIRSTSRWDKDYEGDRWLGDNGERRGFASTKTPGRGKDSGQTFGGGAKEYPPREGGGYIFEDEDEDGKSRGAQSP
jgi:hypothetical protein